MSMSMSKKLVLTAVAVALVLFANNLLSTRVFAADGDPELHRVEMVMDTMTVRVNQERQLWISMAIRQTIPTNYSEELGTYTSERRVLSYATSGTEDWPVTWTTSNPEVAIVNEIGLVTGISPGTAVITATVEKDRHTDLSASCTVTVPSSVLTGIELQTSNEALSNENTGERIDATRLRADAEAAVKAAAPGETATLTYSERTVVSTAALRSASFSAAYENGQVRLRFRTLDETGAVQGQLIIRPELAPEDDYDILLGVNTNSQSARNAAAMGKSYFGASQSVGMVLSHSGSYGMSVEAAVKADFADGSAVRIYRYASGGYTLVENAGCWMDTGGYLHFNVDRGGTYVAVV